MKLTIKEILKITQGKLLCGDENKQIKTYSKDTRTIQKGDCYVGIKGETFDGNHYYEEAKKSGASACILEHFEGTIQDNETFPIIHVEDSIKAIQRIAAYTREHLNIKVVAVTGSAGKTSTKDAIASVLSKKYKVLKTPGNLNGQIGLPFNILQYQDEEVLVLEMGMNEKGQIDTLSKIAKPDIAVITNVGTAHIGILGSRENILSAKLEI
ncbi:MAG: UDP-N-acetylmuramoyl-tripeptide--D-alanyl-D-alanine ligase, partial [Bacilli bacterium]|nr:UDP-N-acetylmuramoyl-tripeptide--D-alanyl-D-alanine ligase [Bacilli bacterium]